MMRNDLLNFLNHHLRPDLFKDYGPNGLQIEGKERIRKVAFGVSACREVIDAAVEFKADALIVHHGLIWKDTAAKPITGALAKRWIPLIKHDINLIGYHLPLDAQPVFGHAACIARKLGLEHWAPFGDHEGMPIGVKGSFPHSISPKALGKKLEEILDHAVVVSTPDEKKGLKTMGILTGGAGGHWPKAVDAGLDAYLTGEISEYHWYDAKEAGLTLLAGGHTATERFGLLEIEKMIKHEFKLDTLFIDTKNPI